MTRRRCDAARWVGWRSSRAGSVSARRFGSRANRTAGDGRTTVGSTPTQGEWRCAKAIAIAGLAVASLAAAAVAAVRARARATSSASSHREAPLIAEDPSADLTDVYAFRSPDKPGTVTILANVIPGEDPAAGPNWYTFSPGARYNINVDTNGDVKPDVMYRFQFKRNDGPVLPRRHGTAVHGDADRRR